MTKEMPDFLDQPLFQRVDESDNLRRAKEAEFRKALIKANSSEQKDLSYDEQRNLFMTSPCNQATVLLPSPDGKHTLNNDVQYALSNLRVGKLREAGGVLERCKSTVDTEQKEDIYRQSHGLLVQAMLAFSMQATKSSEQWEESAIKLAKNNIDLLPQGTFFNFDRNDGVLLDWCKLNRTSEVQKVEEFVSEANKRLEAVLLAQQEDTLDAASTTDSCWSVSSDSPINSEPSPKLSGASTLPHYMQPTKSSQLRVVQPQGSNGAKVAFGSGVRRFAPTFDGRS